LEEFESVVVCTLSSYYVAWFWTFAMWVYWSVSFNIPQEKLCSSRNKVEVSIGKKIDSDIIPELNKLQQVFLLSF
jgi:hypothetical protein